MIVKDTSISGLKKIQPTIYKDRRGEFLESFNSEKLKLHGIPGDFVQDNISISEKDVLRGLHFQNPPYEQGKLVFVLKGSVIDVAVDIRRKSPTYGRHYMVELSEKNKSILWIPPGFAHGFTSLIDGTIFFYKCTKSFNKQSEGNLLWNDKDLNIAWPIVAPILSKKDKVAPSFRNFKSKF